jgi:hypothetical protein
MLISLRVGGSRALIEQLQWPLDDIVETTPIDNIKHQGVQNTQAL